jgi:hypothetical protein
MTGGHGERRQYCNEETATRLCEVLGVDPAGLEPRVRAVKAPARRGMGDVLARKGTGDVLVDPLREAALRRIERGSTWSEIAYEVGFVKADGMADTSGLKRMLGLMAGSRGEMRKACSEGWAGRLALALGVAPTDLEVLPERQRRWGAREPLFCPECERRELGKTEMREPAKECGFCIRERERGEIREAA